MSKIAIISQPNEGVLIDVSGCSNLKEALEHLSSTLQVSSQFWQGLNVSINLGKLKLDSSEAAQILAIAKGVGITPSAVYTKNSDTKVALIENGVNIGEGKPMSLPKININTDDIGLAEVVEARAEKPKSTVARLKLRVADALNKRKAIEDDRTESFESMDINIKENNSQFAQDEKSIRETISNRIISLQKEAEANGDTTEGPKLSVALTENEEAIDSEVRITLESTDQTSTDPRPQSELTSKRSEQSMDVSQLDGLVDAIEEINGSESTGLDPESQSLSESTAEILPGADTEVNESNTAELRVTIENQPEPNQLAEAVVDPVEDSAQEIEQGHQIDQEVVEAEAEIEAEEEVDWQTESDSASVESPENIASSDDSEDGDDIDQLTETINVVVRPNTGGTMYLRQTLRSGQTVSHKGHLIIIGDVNPGAEVMAEGDITIWGSLRGIAHAGIGGNVESEIRALKLLPIQIRIAHAIARSPDKPRLNYSSSHGPETARIVAGKIRVFRSRLE